ncbi:MAG TPA: DUF1343 domain-containing protein [Candidatus Hydrogenedentes bacterium]|jgi:uncharacterized protein YbbC (DUF1343 family)|nr:MAG: D-alanyl-D-alanine carboxypeptidase precursor [Candidatus Hydrogenedentes bacterium ADurb.Bin170]HNZ49356.1 DUF1343 domain-containing protein [Candidatus Hydrogenedentota bacterium]HOD96243.1 DUF1343 domain-containing protein [Candidatus Hydrogenedentota bacterium]HOR50685.1 DUF1343 domain-containing protein [Candidatus Hydrogenedentota bacterium]HPK24128.1 DUF1343 domain-containing protein [Candidatus Hydrogenedentota bacterium]
MQPHDYLMSALSRAVADAQAPGAVACVGENGRTIFKGATGFRALVPEKERADTETIYDLASLTKVIATTTSVLLLREQAQLDLDDALYRYLPLANLDKVSIRQVLTHTAGLVSWKAFYTELSGPLAYTDAIARLAASRDQRGTRVYSDLGFILLTRVIEEITHESFDVFCREQIFQPLKMVNTFFKPAPSFKERCAPTEKCSWRKRLIRGEVHDQNAFAMGGVSGHAGLFSTAADLELFCQALLSGKILSEATLTDITREGQVPGYPWQGLGWWIDPWTSGANGYLPSRTAFGHTGWTGTSMWMDRSTGVYAVLLSNTCHPDVSHRNNGALRRTFYSKVASLFYKNSANAHTGLDALVRNDFEEIKGKRLGVLTNSAAQDQTGRSAALVLGQSGAATVMRFFSPEHGFQGEAEAGEAVGSKKDGTVPVISLYGGKSAPDRKDLQGIDLFVVDLPDIGARYYTYMATMKECMASCAEAQIPVLVLDRPNPLGGLVLEGKPAEEFGTAVCCAPVPVRHGMTLGEVALFFQEQFFKGKKLELRIVKAENWWYDFTHPESALPWTPPSPNIPTPDTALLYIGTCLFEGVNMNEGRGTERPFRICGAPWLKAEEVIAAVEPSALEGCTLKPALYIPKSIPGKAANPEYKDQLCHGIEFEITDRRTIRPFAMVTAVLSAIHKRHPELQWRPFFDVLAGGPYLRTALQGGLPVNGILESMRESLEDFSLRRPRLYQTLEERERL